jgi:thiamine transport system permease protein
VTAVRHRTTSNYPSGWSALAGLPGAAWLALFIGVPVVALVVRVVDTDSLRVLRMSVPWRIGWFTLWQAVLSAVTAVVVALPVTWVLARHDFRMRRSVRAIVVSGFLLPSVVVGTAFVGLLPEGLQRTWIAVVVAHAWFNVAVVVRVVGVRWERIDTGLTDAAALLGAAPLRRLRTVTLPLLAPALAAASALVFLFCFTSYGIVRLLGGPGRVTIESDISLRALQIGDVGAAAVLAVAQAAFLIVVAALSTTLGPRIVRGVALPRIAARRIGIGAARRPRLVKMIVAATLVVVCAPLVTLVVGSLRVGSAWSLGGWRSLFAGNPVRGSVAPSIDLLAAVSSSLRVALVALVIAIVLGACTAFAAVHGGRGGRIGDSLALVPLAISPVTVGLGMIVAFGPNAGNLRASWWIVPIAHSLVALPLVVRLLVPVLRAVPPGLRDAAATLGASPWRTLRSVDLSLTRRALAGAGGLVVAVSVGEFGASSLLTRRGAETIPVVIARLMSRTGDVLRTQAFVLSTVLAVLCIAAMILVERGDAAR